MSRGPILIVGASGRAAAGSMRRAGYEPHVIDLFADADTQRLAATQQVDLKDYPSGLVKLAGQLPPMPWMYAGGLENHPNIVDAISRRHTLLGNGGSTLRAVRDPFQLADAVRALGSRFPLTVRTAHDATKRWLRKSRRSSGGLGVADYHSGPIRNDEYLQEYIAGESISAAYDGATLLGVSRQDCGTHWLHAPPYHYCGSVRHDYRLYHAEFERLGRGLCDAFGLQSFWGLDAIATPDCVWILELNPRYTSSMELFEIAGEIGLGKAIYYAPRALTFPSSGPWADSLATCTDVTLSPGFADIPAPGTRIERGRPVLTYFVGGTALIAIFFKMKALAAELDRHFGAAP